MIDSKGSELKESHKIPLWAPTPPSGALLAPLTIQGGPFARNMLLAVHPFSSEHHDFVDLDEKMGAITLLDFSLFENWICFDSFCNLADCKKLWKATPTSWVHLYKRTALKLYFDWNMPQTHLCIIPKGKFSNRKRYHRYTNRTRQCIIDMIEMVSQI